jgi:hypothetical protein
MLAGLLSGFAAGREATDTRQLLCSRMSSSPERPWKVEVDALNSLKANVDDTVLALRLGMAISAIRAAQRLTICAGEGEGPGFLRDRLWAFVLAVAYIHEARVTLQPRFPKVKELAIRGGATEDLSKEIAELLSGKSDLTKILNTVRNTLVFHFDEDAARQWVEQYEGDTVLWAQGIGRSTGNVSFNASLDVVAAGLLPTRIEDEAGEEGRRRLRKVIENVVRAMDRLTTFFEHAMAGYIDSVSGKLTYLDQP